MCVLRPRLLSLPRRLVARAPLPLQPLLDPLILVRSCPCGIVTPVALVRVSSYVGSYSVRSTRAQGVTKCETGLRWEEVERVGLHMSPRGQGWYDLDH